MLGAAGHRGDNVWLDRLQRLDNHILNTVHHCLEVYPNFVEVVLELRQVPLRSVLSIVIIRLLFAAIGTGVLDVVLVLLIHRVIRQMNEPLIYIFLAVCVFLRREASQTFLEEVNFQRVEARDERVDAQIILKAVDQVRVAHVLGDHVAWLALDFLLLPDNLDASAARGR